MDKRSRINGANSFVFLVALIAGLAGFVFGFDSSVLADVKDQIIIQLHLSNWQWSQVVSASLFGCLVGIPSSGFFTNKVSGRFLLKLTSVGFILGTVLCAASTNLISLLCGRVIIGFCVGIGSYVAPLFISEIAPPDRRGTLVLINGLAITFGQAMAYLMGYFFHDITQESWRYLFLIGCIPAFILFWGMIFVPHSPRWLLRKSNGAEALSVLKKIRPVNYDVLRELHEMQIHKVSASVNYSMLFKKPIMYVLFLGIGLGIFQQVSGINMIMYYGPVLFESAGFFPVKNAILATFFIGMINFVFTIFTLIYIDKLGRRFLLLYGTLIASISLCMVGYLFGHPFFGQKFWILGLLCLYVTGYCISLGSLFWVLISEIYPLSVRGMCMSIATTMQCAANFMISISFLTIYDSMGQMATFLLFGMLCFFAFLFVYYFVPETKGVSLEQIEENLMQGKKIRNIGQPLSPSHKPRIVHPSRVSYNNRLD